MKYGLLITLLFTAFVGQDSIASGCSCTDFPSQRLIFNRSSAVFFGEVVDISESDVPLFNDDPKVLSYAVTFKVIEFWKGVKGPEITVHSDMGGLSCSGFKFWKGKKYLIYAEGKNLIVFTACHRSAPEGSSFFVSEYAGLGKGKRPKIRIDRPST